MNNNKITKRISIFTALLCLVMMSTSGSFALWWGTPGYEWSLQQGLTGVKTRSQLQETVELDDLYSTILTYLDMKNVLPKNTKLHHEDKMFGIDNVARGIFDRINSYNDRNSLTISQFYIVENYATEGYKTLDEYKALSTKLSRQDMKNIESYLRLSKYRAAMLIEDINDREYALSRLGYIKNSRIVNYGMMPYTSKISRREFLILMFDLLSKSNPSGGSTGLEPQLQAFYDAGVLIGYDTGLELDKLLNYTEMYTFLYRFEIYDFETNTEKNALSGIRDLINDALDGSINKQELTVKLDDIASNTNYQIDLIAELENEYSESWTVREAGEYLSRRLTGDGFSYSNGSDVIKVQGW